MMNDCLGTLVEIMLKRIEILELRIKKLETHNYNLTGEILDSIPVTLNIIQETSKGVEDVTNTN